MSQIVLTLKIACLCASDRRPWPSCSSALYALVFSIFMGMLNICSLERLSHQRRAGSESRVVEVQGSKASSSVVVGGLLLVKARSQGNESGCAPLRLWRLPFWQVDEEDQDVSIQQIAGEKRVGARGDANELLCLSPNWVPVKLYLVICMCPLS